MADHEATHYSELRAQVDFALQTRTSPSGQDRGVYLSDEELDTAIAETLAYLMGQCNRTDYSNIEVEEWLAEWHAEAIVSNPPVRMSDRIGLT